MNDFFFARSQMAVSLIFHIVFAAVGIGMPVLMALAEGMYLWTRHPLYLELAKRWAKGTAILFAVGAVSGTVLSFELGLLWPTFMEKAGAIIGMPFSLEGFAFFTEAIFLGMFLYGWKVLSPVAHWVSGLLVAISGTLSGIFVVMANAWMNTPVGFDFSNGQFTHIDPVAAMFNPAMFHEVLHMTLAAFVATGFAVAAVHAFLLLRTPGSEFHRRALGLALLVACVSAPLQMISGDVSARSVAHLQPAKLAAMEAVYKTEVGPDLYIGGIPNDQTQTIEGAIRIPHGLSFLVSHRFDTKVPGLDVVPRADWPDVILVHTSFDVMVFCGTFLFAVSAAAGWLWWRRRRVPDGKWFLRAVVISGPLGFLAIETGWMVTELGRQPWVIYHFLRTADAVTPMHSLATPFILFTALYAFLGLVVIVLLRRQFLQPDSHA